MFVDGMFKDKIGCILSDEDMKKYEKEGENRYANKIPPGYEDNNKDSNKYGGFFIWKEINEKSKDENKHIIFITEHKKRRTLLCVESSRCLAASQTSPCGSYFPEYFRAK